MWVQVTLQSGKTLWYFAPQATTRNEALNAALNQPAGFYGAGSGNVITTANVFEGLPPGQRASGNIIDPLAAAPGSGPADDSGSPGSGGADDLTEPNIVDVSVDPNTPVEQRALGAAFERFLQGQGLSQEGTFARQFGLRQSYPFQTAFLAHDVANPTAFEPERAFERFLANAPPSAGSGGINPGGALGLTVRDIFQGLRRGRAPGEDTGFSSTFRNPLNPSEGERAANLVRQAALSRYSPYTRGIIRTPSNEELFSQFSSQREAGSGENYFDYLARRYGLASLPGLS